MRGKPSISKCRETAVAAAALQTCLLPDSHTPRSKNVKETVTSVMLNHIVPRETSRAHSLLLSTQGINFFLPLAVLFPCVLWDRRTQVFLEGGLCTLTPSPAPWQNRRAWNAKGRPTLAMEMPIQLEISLKGVLEKGKIEQKRKREKK